MGRDQSTEALTSLEVGQFASRLDALLLNVHYRTNRRVTPSFCPGLRGALGRVTIGKRILAVIAHKLSLLTPGARRNAPRNSSSEGLRVSKSSLLSLYGLCNPLLEPFGLIWG